MSFTMKSKVIKGYIVNILLLIFFNHGFLYFLYPEDIYNIESPIRWIKYIVILVLLLLVLKDCKFSNIFFYGIISISLMLVYIIAVGSNFSLASYLTIIIPLSIFYFYEGISKYIKIFGVTMITYIIVTIFGYIEFIFLHGLFWRFADSGYRIISIFVNPNNLGLVVAVLTFYILGEKRLNNIMVELIIYLNSALLIFLTGSKNAMFIYFIVTVLFVLYTVINLLVKSEVKPKIIMLVTGGSVIVLGFIMFYSNLLESILSLLLQNTRQLGSINLFSGRISQFIAFFENVQLSFLFPNQEIFANTDNLYFYLWGVFGLPILLLFIVFNGFLLCKLLIKNDKQKIILLIIFLIAGIGENFLYFWPLGYLYWYLVASIMKSNGSGIQDGNYK